MNDVNLRTLTTAEAREIGRIGGKASVASRRTKKAMQEAWEAIRVIPIKAGDIVDLDEIQSIAQLKGANITIEQAAVLAIAKKAMRGDVHAFEVLSKMTESRQRTSDLAAKKAALEVEKLRIEITAYKRAATIIDVGVSIIDNIPE